MNYRFYENKPGDMQGLSLYRVVERRKSSDPKISNLESVLYLLAEKPRSGSKGNCKRLWSRKIYTYFGTKMKKYVLDLMEEVRAQMLLPVSKRDSSILALASVALKDYISVLEEMLCEQKQKISALEKDIYIDPLTMLFTRKGLYKHLESIREEDQKEYDIYLADISGLKRINDNFGISVGDYVIRSVAFGIRSRVKSEDFVCRYGYSKSDEFLVLSKKAKIHRR